MRLCGCACMFARLPAYARVCLPMTGRKSAFSISCNKQVQSNCIPQQALMRLASSALTGRRLLQIAEGADADILLLDAHSWELRYVVAKGVVVRTPEWVRGGLFEEGPRIRPVQPVL